MIDIPDFEDMIDAASRRWEASERYDELDCLCPDCGQRYSGSDRSGGHCRGRFGGCCQSFRSNYAASKHRTGPHQDGQRRCFTEDELLPKGWSKDEQGAWRTAPPGAAVWPKP